MLLENIGKTVSKSRLEDLLYSWDDAIESNTIEVHIHYLRKKIGYNFIKTLRGVGYLIGWKDPIKTNLIAKLSSLIALALVAIYFVSFVNTKKEISEVLDADLIKSAKLIFGVVQHDSFVEHSANLDAELQQKILNQFEYKIHAQAWKKDKII